jgi:hypothetical protein
MQVVLRVPGLDPDEIVLQDVHSPGEADTAVHDENFAVVAQVQVGEPGGRERRVKPGDRHSRVT